MTIRTYMYHRYERLWHWFQAVVIVLLFVTGLEVHAPSSVPILGFETAVLVHRWLGFLLIANAFLGFFYHVSTGEIRQFFASASDLFGLGVRQARFYLQGIFRGEPHPFEKRPDRKLNPLQKVTYALILNIFLPLQVATGLLMWGTQRWPDTVGGLGGLSVLGPIHALGSWFFVAFVIMHFYLTTTGRTPLANVRAMIDGWEDVEVTRDEP